MKPKDVVIPISMQGEPEHILDRFRKLVSDGMAPGLATILASRVFPGSVTDTSHYAGIPSLDEAWGPARASELRAQARKAGIVVGDNWHYNPTMADTRCGGDPKAWIGPGDGLSTYKNRVKALGGGSMDHGIEPNEDQVLSREAKREAGIMKRRQRREELAAGKK